MSYPEEPVQLRYRAIVQGDVPLVVNCVPSIEAF